MSTQDVNVTSDADSGDRPEDSTLVPRKTVLMGMAASMGLVFANPKQSAALAGSTVKSIAATTPTYVTQWAPATAYARGQQIVSPSNDVAAAAVAHTSSTVYTSDTAKWNLSATYDRTVNQKVNLRDVVTPSGTDDTAAVNVALAAFAASGGGTLTIPRADWKFTGGLALTGVSVPIHIEADPGCVFDMTQSTAETGLLLGGSVTSRFAALGANAAKFADSISCTLAVSPGDVLRIQSTVIFDGYLNQPKGELVEVLSSTAGVITLKSGLFDSYTAATTTVTLMQMPCVSVEGLEIIHNNNGQGVQIAYARDVLMGGLTGSGARDRLHYLNTVFGGVVDNCTGTDFWYSGTGTSYGLVVASSQHIIEQGNIYRGGRHAVAHGGWFPCRDIQVYGGTFDNYHPSGQPSFDFHSNCEDVRLVGVTVLNGIQSQASNFDASSSTFVGVNKSGVDLYAPRDCDYVRLRDCFVSTNSGQDGVVWVARGSVPTPHKVGLFQVDAVIRSAGYAVSVEPGTSGDTNSTITHMTVSGDAQSFGDGCAVLTTKSGAASVTITEMELSGRMRAEAANAVVLAGKGGVVRISGKISTGKASGYPISISGVTDAYLENMVVQGTNNPYRSEFSNTGKLHLKGVTIDGGSSTGGVWAVGPSEVMLNNVSKVNTTGAMTLPARTIEGFSMLGNSRASGAAAPVAGTWQRGDEVTNAAPAVGSPKSWVCTRAGTPGTWVSTGNL
jgi:hypothetical protein